MPISELSLAVVGVAFENADGGNRRSEIMFCSPGEPVELVPEPRNPADPHAVMVLSARHFQIGYLSAERAPWIGRMLREGRHLVAIFQEQTPYGAVIRVNLDGSLPTLPAKLQPVEDQSDNDPDFWPDFDPPDDFG